MINQAKSAKINKHQYKSAKIMINQDKSAKINKNQYKLAKIIINQAKICKNQQKSGRQTQGRQTCPDSPPPVWRALDSSKKSRALKWLIYWEETGVREKWPCWKNMKNIYFRRLGNHTFSWFWYFLGRQKVMKKESFSQHEKHENSIVYVVNLSIEGVQKSVKVACKNM